MSSLHTQGKWLVEEETCVVNEVRCTALALMAYNPKLTGERNE